MGKLSKLKSGIDDAVRAAKNGLDMSAAARMKRAADQGFNPQTLYHGTKANIDAFKATGLKRASAGGQSSKGRISLTTDPEVASRYATNIAQGKGLPRYPSREDVTQMFIDTSQPDRVAHAEWYFSAGDKRLEQIYRANDWRGGNVLPVRIKGKVKIVDASSATPSGASGFKWFTTQENLAKSEGFDAVRFENVPADVFPDDVGKVTVFAPENIRSVNAAFAPANAGSSNLLGAATIGGMATAGAVGAGLMGAQAYDFGAPDYDAKIRAFNERRQAKRQIWKELKEAGATIASAIPAGIVSDAYRIGGYLSPVTSLDETEQGAEAVQNALMYTPEGDNRYLNEFARQVNQFEQDVQPLVNAWKQTPIYQGYKQLPERAQRLIKTASDYAF